MVNMYSHVFVAGTFDGLHKGHAFLLSCAFEAGKQVTIGLTSDIFVQKFKISNSQFSNNSLKIRGYARRKQELETWLNSHGYKERAQVVPIDDPYEPAASDPQVEALVVTAQNKHRGEEINQKREQRGLKLLILVEVPLVPAEDGQPISTTRVRNGEIDKTGRLIMPETLRPQLQLPLGQVLTGSEIISSLAAHRQQLLIAVGDVAAKTLLDAGVRPTLAIIDGKVGRKPFYETLKMLQLQKVKPFSLKPVKSGPGYISGEAIRALQAILERQGKLFFSQHLKAITHHVIIIDGEEDLLVLPAVIHAPLGTVIYYGQPARNAFSTRPLRYAKHFGQVADAGGPGEGLVEVVVTKKKQEEALALIAQFLS